MKETIIGIYYLIDNKNGAGNGDSFDLGGKRNTHIFYFILKVRRIFFEPEEG